MIKKPQIIAEVDTLIQDFNEASVNVSREIQGVYPNGHINFNYRISAKEYRDIDAQIAILNFLKIIKEKCEVEGFGLWYNMDVSVQITYTKEQQIKDGFKIPKNLLDNRNKWEKYLENTEYSDLLDEIKSEVENFITETGCFFFIYDKQEQESRYLYSFKFTPDYTKFSNDEQVDKFILLYTFFRDIRDKCKQDGVNTIIDTTNKSIHILIPYININAKINKKILENRKYIKPRKIN